MGVIVFLNPLKAAAQQLHLMICFCGFTIFLDVFSDVQRHGFNLTLFDMFCFFVICLLVVFNTLNLFRWLFRCIFDPCISYFLRLIHYDQIYRYILWWNHQNSFKDHVFLMRDIEYGILYKKHIFFLQMKRVFFINFILYRWNVIFLYPEKMSTSLNYFFSLCIIFLNFKYFSVVIYNKFSHNLKIFLFWKPERRNVKKIFCDKFFKNKI